MSKIIRIHDCSECPFYTVDDHRLPRCNYADRVLPYRCVRGLFFRSIPIYTGTIPDWCPLPDA